MRFIDLCKKSVLLLAVVFALKVCCIEQTAFPEPFSKLPESSVTKEILPNGLTVMVKEEHAHPIVTILATVGAGLSSEGTNAGSGISHLLEHMIFKGTSERAPGQIEEEIKSYGGMINATTGLDSATFYATVPKEYQDKTLRLMEDILFGSLFDAGEMAKEKDVILKEIRLNKDDPARRVMRELWATSFTQHPYRFPVIGYEGVFKELERKDLIKYYSSRFVPQNITLAIVGDVKTEQTIKFVKSLFGKHKEKAPFALSLPLEPEQKSLREMKESIQINLGYLSMGYHTVSLDSEDLYALDVLSIVLGNWDGSRLNKSLVKDRRQLYTVSSFNYTPKYPGLFIIYAIGDPKKLTSSAQEIIKEIENIALEGIDKKELDAAKNMVISGYISSLETTGGLANAMSQGEFLLGNPDFSEKYVEEIKKVDSSAVKAVAAKYLRENNLTISYLYPKGFDIGSVGKKPIQAVKAASSKVSAKPAFTRVTKIGRISQERGISGGRKRFVSSKSKKIILPNGMRLILKEDKRIPKLDIVCAFTGGVMVETKETNGISNLTASMLLKGTKNRNESEITAFLESSGSGISYFSGKNTFGLSASALSENAYSALEVLTDVIKNPAFPEEEIEKEKEKINAAIVSQDDDIFATGFLKLQKNIFKDYPYGLRALGETGSLKNLTRKDLEDFHKKFCVSGNMVIAVVGDFDASKMRREIEKRFSDMNNAPLRMRTKKISPLGAATKINYDMKRDQSLVLAGFRGTTLGSPDKYYLAVLSSILSGENGRLYMAIRNKLGLAYTLGTFSVPGIKTGYLASYVATDKKHLKATERILIKELKMVSRGQISEKELDLARKSLIGRQKISLQSHKALAYQIVLDEIYDLGYDTYLRYPGIISKISKSDIVRTAKKYFNMKKSVTVTIAGSGYK